MLPAGRHGQVTVLAKGCRRGRRALWEVHAEEGQLLSLRAFSGALSARLGNLLCLIWNLALAVDERGFGSDCLYGSASLAVTSG